MPVLPLAGPSTRCARHDGAGANHGQPDGKEERTAVNDEQTILPTGSEPAEQPADPRTAEPRGLPATHRSPSRPRRRKVIADEVDPVVLAMAHRIVELAADKKASDIILLDVRAQTAMTDYFVICSGSSDRQLRAIADGIVEGVKDDGAQPLSREGDVGSHWLLIDFGGVIVHVMSRPEREFYQLEQLWSEAALLLHLV
jgi:ribosome-associated protein